MKALDQLLNHPVIGLGGFLTLLMLSLFGPPAAVMTVLQLSLLFLTGAYVWSHWGTMIASHYHKLIGGSDGSIQAPSTREQGDSEHAAGHGGSADAEAKG